MTENMNYENRERLIKLEEKIDSIATQVEELKGMVKDNENARRSDYVPRREFNSFKGWVKRLGGGISSFVITAILTIIGFLIQQGSV